MINIVGDTIIKKFSKPYYAARREVNWDISKYGTDPEGTSICLEALKNKSIKYHIFIFTENNLHIRISSKKVMEYLKTTPNALTEKFGETVVVTPLSLFENVPSGKDIDIDVNQFK